MVDHPPTVFISYSHDSREHADRVLALADRLRAEGVDVILDQYEGSPAEGWPRWMDRHIENADFVLMICTRTYFHRVTGKEEVGKGLGVRWEGNLIYQYIYDAGTQNTRFIPILFEDGDPAYIPKPVRGVTQYRIDSEYEGLYRQLTNQPAAEKPELGKLRRLPSRQPQWIHRPPSDINILVQGITALHTDYATRVQNFLTQYLGTPEQPVPFGGRECDLARLNAWLVNPEASPYLLLAAPAGRGKSALLVQWSQQLLEQNDWAVVFFPVSIRFRTNLASVVFATLTARLAALHDEKLSVTPDTSVEICRGMMADYLNRPLPDGRRVLLILDGVDEAAGWEAAPDLFSLSPPKKVRVLVSARYLAGDVDANAWLGRLEWDRPGLAYTPALLPLDQAGVADVLNRMGVPLDRLGARVDIVAELYRLSEGDPLLVRLYVDDLWVQGEAATRLEPEELSSIRPGLEGYFAKWWKDQYRLWGNQSPLRERAVQAILNLLTCALGPLTQKDVRHLAPPEANLTTWMLDETLRPLARFIFGDGRKQGYTFSHPRLGNHFYEKLSEHERQAVESRFLNWGKETLAALDEGQLAPEKASVYLVQYYGAHLERVKSSVETFQSLVSKGWQRAWYRLEGAYGGFLNDVHRVWRAAEQANKTAAKNGKVVPYLGIEVRCALYQVSINSLATNIPPFLLLLLVKQKVWTPMQGLAYARQIVDVENRAEILGKLTLHLSEPVKGQVLQEAFQAARTIGYEGARAQALGTLAPHLDGLLLQKVLEAARVIGNMGDRARVLEASIPHLDGLLLQKALEVAWNIWNEGYPVPVLGALIPHLDNLDGALKDHVLQEVLQAARAIEDTWHRARVLGALAPYLDGVLKDHVLQEALQAARTIGDEGDRARVLEVLVSQLDGVLLQEALEAVRAIRDGGYRAQVLRVLASQLDRALLQKALEVARTIRHEEYRARVLGALAPQLDSALKDRVLQEALQAARAIGNEGARARVLGALAPQLDSALKDRVLQEALEAAWAIRDEGSRAKVLIALAPQLDGPLLEKAVEAARTIRDERSRAKVLIALAPQLDGPLQGCVLQEALKAARTIWYGGYRARVLGALAPQLDSALKDRVLQEALEAARAIGNKGNRVQALGALVPHLDGALKDRVLQEALQAARAIGNEEDRVQALGALVPYLDGVLKDRVLQEALQAARAIGNEGDRVQALGALVPHLDGALKDRVLQEALEVVRAIRDEGYRARVLGALAPYLDGALKDRVLQEAFEVARAIGNEGDRARVLGALAPQLNGVLLQEAFEVARAIGNEGDRARVLRALAPQLNGVLLQEAFEAVRTIGDEWHRAQVLGALALWLDGPLLQKALEAAQAIEDERDRAQVLGALAPRLDGVLLQEALQAARAIGDEWRRAQVLEALAPRLDGALREQVLQEALQAVWAIGDEWHQTEALGTLAPHLDGLLKGQVLEGTLQVVRAIGDEGYRARVLGALAPRLDGALREQVLQEALQAARAIGDEGYRAQVLGALAPRLDGALREQVLQEALQAVWAIGDEGYRARVLGALAPYLNGTLKDRVLQEAFEVTRAIGNKGNRAEALGALAPHLDGALKGQVLQEALEAARVLGDKGNRIRVLSKLAPHLADLPFVTLYTLWHKTLPILAARHRSDLLADIRALSPVIVKLGGEKAIREIVGGIQDVSRWWP